MDQPGTRTRDLLSFQYVHRIIEHSLHSFICEKKTKVLQVCSSTAAGTHVQRVRSFFPSDALFRIVHSNPSTNPPPRRILLSRNVCMFLSYLSTGEPLSGLHSDGAHGVLSQVLRHLQHQSRCSLDDGHLFNAVSATAGERKERE